MGYVFLSRILKLLVIFFSIAFASSVAQASNYAGASIAYTNTEYSSQGSKEGNPWLIQAQFGHYFNDYFALEARYGVSIGRSGGISVDSLASLLAKGNVPISERVAVYGLLGGSAAKLDQQDAADSTEAGVSFGIGMHYALGKNSAVTFEYLSSLNLSKAKIGGLGLAYQYRF